MCIIYILSVKNTGGASQDSRPALIRL